MRRFIHDTGALTLKVHAVHSLMAASMLALDQTVLIDVDRLIHYMPCLIVMNGTHSLC